MLPIYVLTATATAKISILNLDFFFSNLIFLLFSYTICSGNWLIVLLINISIAVCIMVAAMIFNKIYLASRFANILQIEGDGPKNLISFKYFIAFAIALVLNFFMIIVLRTYGDHGVPLGACSYMIISSISLGTFANKLNIKLYFCHYLQQVYQSSSLFHSSRIMPSQNETH